MDVNFNEVIQATGAQTLGQIDGNAEIFEISTDSRALDKADLFFALTGKNFDGHDFIKEAIEKKVKVFVVSNPEKILPEFKNSAAFFVVKDTLKAYGDLAQYYRQKFKIPAIAITGSSGKTTVKELTAHILSQAFKVLKNRGTENNLIGVPKTLLQLEKSHEIMILEMGASIPGEINRLSSILAPQIGILTQIGMAHIEGFGTQEGIKIEKLSVLNHLERGGMLIVNGQDPLLKDVKSGMHKILRVGLQKENNDLWADQLWCHEAGSSFHLNGKDLCETPLLGRHNVFNCLLAIMTANLLGVKLPVIQKALSSFNPVAGRLTAKSWDGIQFLDDTYNSNPSSFKASLETLKDFKMRGRKGVVCGDMLELGDQAITLHETLGALIADWLFDFVIAAGPLSKHLVDGALKRGFDPQRIHHVKDSAAAGKLCREIARAGDLILVKGSRGMKMEKVFECFITSSTR
ncbi:MAG: hypothetical protein AUJ72_00510 [Candidatus Omnitrophica bacterium CG1_02_46_14]|nr:MAG: hypothetical protein AUJ72_00510 [Candidatus Omnitrophica bacterium CG1_02_46_14]